MVVTRAGGENGDLLFNGDRVSVETFKIRRV